MKFLLCSFILPSLVCVFMTITLNSLSGKLLTCILLRFFFFFMFYFVLSLGTYSSVSSFGLILWWFLCIRLKQLPFSLWRSCVGDEPYCSTLPQLLAVSQNLWLSKQPVLFLLAPSIWLCAKSCQCPKRRFSVNPEVKIDWRSDSKVATFKVCKYASFGGSLGDGCFCLYLLY